MIAPPVISLGTEFSIIFQLYNKATSSEKINILVMLSEYYLLAGNTSTVLEVSPSMNWFCFHV